MISSKSVSSNLKALKAMIAYLSKLRQARVLNDEEYKLLLNYACTLFVEQETKIKIEDVLEQKITQAFEKIAKSLS